MTGPYNDPLQWSNFPHFLHSFPRAGHSSSFTSRCASALKTPCRSLLCSLFDWPFLERFLLFVFGLEPLDRGCITLLEIYRLVSACFRRSHYAYGLVQRHLRPFLQKVDPDVVVMHPTHNLSNDSCGGTLCAAVQFEFAFPCEVAKLAEPVIY